MPRSLQLHINGTTRQVDAGESQSLLSVLRDKLDLTGTKYGCGEGQCGACTVLLEGIPIRSCITPASKVAGREVTTIEGLEKNGELHPLQSAFLEAGALQCGYCTSGMIMSGVALVEKNPGASEDEIRRFMQGNICRCGTYARIVTAIQTALKTAQQTKR